MMANYKIITDSTTDLSPALVAQAEVLVIPMEFTIDDNTYFNDPEESQLSSHAFYDLLRAGKTSTTSQINGVRMQEFFEPLLKEGVDILYLAFSSGLSGTYHAGKLAAEELSEKYPARKIIVVDTLAASMGEGLLVWLAAEQMKKGADIDNVAAFVRQNRLHLAHWFTVDDLNHLKRGGRVSGAAAFFGTMLNIKPVLHVDNEGHLIPKEKVRGRKASLDALLDHMEKTGVRIGEQTVFVSHGDCAADCDYVVEQLKKRFGVKKYSQTPSAL